MNSNQTHLLRSLIREALEQSMAPIKIRTGLAVYDPASAAESSGVPTSTWIQLDKGEITAQLGSHRGDFQAFLDALLTGDAYVYGPTIIVSGIIGHLASGRRLAWQIALTPEGPTYFDEMTYAWPRTLKAPLSANDFPPGEDMQAKLDSLYEEGCVTFSFQTKTRLVLLPSEEGGEVQHLSPDIVDRGEEEGEGFPLDVLQRVDVIVDGYVQTISGALALAISRAVDAGEIPDANALV